MNFYKINYRQDGRGRVDVIEAESFTEAATLAENRWSDDLDGIEAMTRNEAAGGAA